MADRQGVVTIDRLSTVNIGPVKDLTGGKIISSLSTRISPNHLGCLNAIKHTSVHGKRYLVLEGNRGYCSLMLSCQTDYIADELKSLCSSVLSVLRQCLHSPYVVHGGGCLETQLSHFLLTKASEDCSKDLLQDMKCNEKTFKVILKSVASSFQSVAVCLEHYGGTVLTDSSSHHCWFFPPDDYCMSELVDGSGKTQREEMKEREVEKRGNESSCDKSAETKSGIELSNTVTTTADILVVQNDKLKFRSIPLQSHSLSTIHDINNKTGHAGVCKGTDDRVKENPRRNEADRWEGKTCGCGCVKLSELPSTCEWIPLGDNKCSIYTPDLIEKCLKEATKANIYESVAVDSECFPIVCDAFSTKLKAIETANDLASSLLRIAFSISEKMSSR